MRVLPDEDVPHDLRRELPEHDVSTVTYAGWSGLRNGILLGLAAAAGFQILVTCDRSIQYQQHIPELDLALIVLAVQDTRLPTILPLVPEIRATLAAEPRRGKVSVVGSWRA